MKSVRRYQSHLLIRRRYKPARRVRALPIAFGPSTRVSVPLLQLRVERRAHSPPAFSIAERWTSTQLFTVPRVAEAD